MQQPAEQPSARAREARRRYEEIRAGRVRTALDQELGYDVDALFRDIRARTDRGEFADFEIVRRPPRPAQPRVALRGNVGDDG